MFRASIMSTPFTTDAANSYFPNIVGETYGSDSSFLATLRALLAPRIKEDESVTLRFGESCYNTANIENASNNQVVKAICGRYHLDGELHGQIIVHNFTSDSESNIANLAIIAKEFTLSYPHYHQLEKVKDFYRKFFAVDCYIDPENKNVVLFADNLTYKKLHYLQVAIFAFLPWYFDPTVGASELEMELIYSLRESTSEKYENCLRKIAKQYDFRAAKIHKLLDGFETRYLHIECNTVRENIACCDRQIQRLNNQIGSILNQRNNHCIELLGLERKITEDEGCPEIVEYFLCNDKLVLENATDTDIYFCVKDYLTYFDTEIAERCINNKRSFVYSDNRETYRGIAVAKMKKLMREIFVEDNPRLKIKACAAYRFNLNGNISACGSHVFPYECCDCMPNPHIDRYSCIGNYEMIINELLQKRDYIGALEQCIASCKSLNWGDSPVMSEFMNTMWSSNNYNNSCIELPDGCVVKPARAIQWLEEQDGAIEEQTTKEE